MSEAPETTTQYNPKLVRWMSGLGFTLSLYVILIDLPTLPKHVHTLYLAGRLATAAICLMVLLTTNRERYTWQVPLMFLTLVAYAAHGQMFLPCYYLAYMEVIIPLGLFFQMQRKQFYPIIALSAAIMLVTIFMSQATYATDPAVAARFRFDAAMGVLITTIASILGYHYIARTRREKDLLSEKFLDVGRHTSSIMHDLKGLLSTPITYAHLLQSKALALAPKDQEVLKYLTEDLTFLNKYVHEVNSYNNLRGGSEPFRLSEIFESMKILLRAPLRKVDLKLVSDPQLKTNKNVLMKVFYNLIINSIEAKSGSERVRLEVGFDSEGHCLYLRDNGPGFSKDNLRALNTGRFAHSSKPGSGAMGTYIVREMIESRGGKIVFGNHPEGGAHVRIFLPKDSEVHPSGHVLSASIASTG